MISHFLAFRITLHFMASTVANARPMFVSSGRPIHHGTMFLFILHQLILILCCVNYFALSFIQVYTYECPLHGKHNCDCKFLAFQTNQGGQAWLPFEKWCVCTLCYDILNRLNVHMTAYTNALGCEPGAELCMGSELRHAQMRVRRSRSDGTSQALFP